MSVSIDCHSSYNIQQSKHLEITQSSGVHPFIDQLPQDFFVHSPVQILDTLQRLARQGILHIAIPALVLSTSFLTSLLSPLLTAAATNNFTAAFNAAFAFFSS